MEECVLGLAVVISPGKHVEEMPLRQRQPLTLDYLLLFSLFCQIIGPQFVSKAFNCTSLQCAMSPAFYTSSVTCCSLIFNIIGEGSVTFPQLLKRRKKVFVSFSLCSCIHHATVDVAAQQKRIVWNVISLSPPSHAGSAARCTSVSERKWDKRAGHSLNSHFDINKGLLHCTSVRYPLLFFRKPFPLVFWHFIITWMAWRDFMAKISSSCKNSVLPNVYLSSWQLRDTTYPNINLFYMQTCEELASFGTNVIPNEGPQILPDPTLPFFLFPACHLFL